jgi:hypothetical protein
MDAFEAGRRKVITRLAARLAEAIRNGEEDVIELCDEVLHPHRRHVKH